MYLWKSNVYSHKLDVQEANVSVSQWVATDSEIISLEVGFANGRYFSFDLWNVVLELLHSSN